MSAPNAFFPNFQPTSPRYYQPQSPKAAQQNLSINQVSRIVGAQVREGERIKGQSRITYMPYQKKVVQYEQRQYVQRVPKIQKVIKYEERQIIQEIPRQVVTTDYYAVQNITQYFKQVIPQKKIQMVPVQKKVKKIQYIPIEKQIVHYPEGQDPSIVQGQSRVVLQNQGVNVRQDAQFRLMDPKLIYNYSSTQYRNNPIGYVEDGFQRNLSTAPTLVTTNNNSQLGYTNPNTTSQVGYFTGPSQTSIVGSQPYSPRGNGLANYSIIQDINIYPNGNTNNTNNNTYQY